ncbi:MAG: hypothetical protein HQ559_03675 [Lentisphaerae bacterium]|nr:hypothetical protein [Lentisphaerota bacterium]
MMSPGDDNETTATSWAEWKRTCALALCSANTRKALSRFAGLRFRTHARRYAYTTGAGQRGEAPTLEPPEAWHLFESHLVAGTTQQGKRYKDWLFARTEGSGDPFLDVIQGGATLIMRDVVREHLRQECPPANTISIQEPLSHGEGEPLTLEDLLPGAPDPTDEVAHREWTRLAADHARATFEDTTTRERAVLAATALGVPMAHPAVKSVTGRSKSVLSTTLRSMVEQVGERIKLEYPDEEPQALIALSLLTVTNLKRLAIEWAKSETACARLFRVVEEDTATA